MNNLEFALEMKNKRLASGLSQGELASLTHVSRYSINRFENGKANASKETQNIILRCLNYYICDKPFYLLVDYLSVRFPTTDALEIIRKVLGMKADYFIHIIPSLIISQNYQMLYILRSYNSNFRVSRRYSFVFFSGSSKTSSRK